MTSTEPADDPTNGLVQTIDSIDLPPDWEYDPGWTWPGTDAAVYHDTYFPTVEPECDTDTGYIIEVQDNQIVLFEVDEYERNTVIESSDRENITDTITEHLETVDQKLQSAGGSDDG